MQNIFFRSSKPRFINKEEIIEKFKNMAKNLTEKNKNISKIYLFGSFAANSYTVRSDADILVVLKHDNRKILERTDEFLLYFSDGPVPVDVVVYTETEMEKMIKEGNSFVKKALKGIDLLK